MVLSMTGFGRAIGEYGKKRFIVEIKSLNSKQLDLSVRMPSVYKEKEIELRTMIGNALSSFKRLASDVDCCKHGTLRSKLVMAIEATT